MATENSSSGSIPPGKGKAKRSHEMDDQESPSWSKIKKIKKANELSSGISSASHSSEPPASRPQSPSSSPQPAQDQIELPEPEYRSVPVNVRRRETRITPAEPPPSNSSTPRVTSALWRNRPSRGQRARKGLGGDDGSGSDSDGGHGRKLDGDDSPVARPKMKKVQVTDNDMGGPSSLSSAALEEDERLRTQRLRAMEKLRIQVNKLSEKHKHAKNPLRENEQTVETSKYPELHITVLRQEKLLRQYCDDALYSDVIDILGGGHKKKDTPVVALEKVALQVEKETIHELSSLDVHDSHKSKYPPAQRFSTIALRMKAYLKEHFGEATEFDDYLVGSLASRFAYDANQRKHEGLPEFMGPLVTDVIHEVIKSAAESLRLGKRPSIMTLFENSRKGKRLSTSYIHFLLGGAYRDIDETQSKVYKEHLVKTMREYCASPKSANTNLRQKFIIGLKSRDSISLVLFKGKFPYTESLVSKEDFESFGWQVEDLEDPEPKYWRFEILGGKICRTYLEDGLGDRVTQLSQTQI